MVTMRIIRAIVLAGAVVVAFASRGDAVVLDTATFREFLRGAGGSVDGTSDSLAETITIGTTLLGSGTATGSATTAGGAIPRAEAHLELAEEDVAFSNIGGSAHAETRYQFFVEPLVPEAVGPVPVILRTTGSASLSAFSEANVFVTNVFARIDHPGGQFQASPCDASGCHPAADSFDETVNMLLAVDAVQTITLFAFGGANLGPGGVFEFDASVDPSVVIDPAFPFRDDFRIVFSPGLCADLSCSPTAVPAPRALILLVFGLAGVATRMWRRPPIH
jgi:hypothetical protein